MVELPGDRSSRRRTQRFGLMDEAGTEEDGIASRTKKPTSRNQEFRGNYLKIVKHCKANQILGTLWTQMGYTVNIYIYSTVYIYIYVYNIYIMANNTIWVGPEVVDLP